MEFELIAYCGLYCGACSFKLAHDTNEMGHLLCMPARYDPHKGAMPEFCPGCRLENQCGPCGIRDCARAKSLDHCGQCDAFPCQRLIDFNGDGASHHAESIANLESLNTLGPEAWLARQREAWTCPCGLRRSWYLPECRHGGSDPSRPAGCETPG